MARLSPSLFTWNRIKFWLASSMTTAFFMGGPVFASVSEMHLETAFLAGYQAYLSGSNGTCASEFEEIKDAFDNLPEGYPESARFYHLYCHYKLEYRAYAAELTKSIHPEKLPRDLELIYRRIEADLAPEIAEIGRAHFWFFPYAGAGQFTPQTSYLGATLFGIYGGMGVSGWNFSAGLESYTFFLPRSPTPYSQILINLNLSRIIGLSSSIRVFFTNITATGTTGHSVQVGGLGTTLGLGPETSLDLDFSGSYFGDLPMGQVAVPIATATLTQYLYTAESLTLGIQLGSEAILPQVIVPAVRYTGPPLLDLYQRWTGSLLASFGPIQASISGWTGSECLGVRNQGTVVFNALRTFNYGYGGFFQIKLSQEFSFKLSLTQESFTESNVTSLSTATTGGLMITL